MLDFDKVEITKDWDISKNGYEYFTIRFKYHFAGAEDETVLECVEKRDVHLAIEAIFKDFQNFRSMYP